MNNQQDNQQESIESIVEEAKDKVLLVSQNRRGNVFGLDVATNQDFVDWLRTKLQARDTYWQQRVDEAVAAREKGILSNPQEEVSSDPALEAADSHRAIVTELERVRISDALAPYTQRLAEKGLGLQDMELQEIVAKIVEVVQPSNHKNSI